MALTSSNGRDYLAHSLGKGLSLNGCSLGMDYVGHWACSLCLDSRNVGGALAVSYYGHRLGMGDVIDARDYFSCRLGMGYVT